MQFCPKVMSTFNYERRDMDVCTIPQSMMQAQIYDAGASIFLLHLEDPFVPALHKVRFHEASWVNAYCDLHFTLFIMFWAI